MIFKQQDFVERKPSILPMVKVRGCNRFITGFLDLLLSLQKIIHLIEA